MKRFIQVVQDDFDDDEKEEFENRCSCAVACGYVPCGNTLQVTPQFSGGGDSEGFNISTDRSEVIMVQCFCDQDGSATMICAHCAKCENCEIAPDEDTYCKKFEDVCYKED